MAELVQLSFRSGIEEGVDPKQLQPGQLLVAENCRQDKEGRLRKRLGTEAVVKTTIAGGTISAGQRLTGASARLALNDGTEQQVYLESLAKWQAADRPPPLLATTEPLIDSTKGVELVDQAVSDDLLVTLYQVSDTTLQGGPIYVFVREISTGHLALQPTHVGATGFAPRVVIRSGTAHLLWSTAAGAIQVRPLSLSTFAFTAAASSIVTGAYASTPFDAQVVGDSLYVAWFHASGADRVTLRKFNLAAPYAVLGTIATGGAIASKNAICIDASNGLRVLLAYSADSLTRGAILNTAATAVTVAPVTLLAMASFHVFIAAHDAAQSLVGYAYLNTASFDTNYQFDTGLVDLAFAAVANTRRLTYWVMFPSKPWRVNGRWFVRAMSFQISTGTLEQPPDPSNVVLEIRTDAHSGFSAIAAPSHQHVATLENQTGWSSFRVGGHLMQPVILDTDVIIASGYRNRALVKILDTSVVGGSVRIPLGWNQHRLSFEGGDLHRLLHLGNVSLGICAAPYVDDGAMTRPAGFIHAPVIIDATANVGTGLLEAGVYQYVACYVWRDARGVLHRGIPSPPKEVTVALNDSVDLKISTTGISSKLDEVTEAIAIGSLAHPAMIEIFRTKVDEGDFYRRTFEPFRVDVNDSQTYTVAINDAAADDDLSGGFGGGVALDEQPQIYTASELEDVPPPAAVAGAVHRGRFALLAADQHTVWLSRVASEDLAIFPGFHEAFTLVFDRKKYALESLDERLVVFGENNIDLVEGDGPDSNGDQNTWKVVGLQTDVGCTNPRSLVSTPFGLMFQSSDGDIVTLTRELAVQWVGRPIADRITAFPVVTSAVLVADAHEVRFTCNAEDGLTGIVLVFDYERGRWFVRRYYDADAAVGDMPIADAALVDGVYTMLLAGGRVYRETEAHCLDAAASYVAMAAEIYVAPAGNQGWSRLRDVQLLGTAITDHDLTISIARDFAASFEQTKLFVAEGDVTTPGPLEKARVTLARQKGQAFRVRVEDAEPNSGTVGTGEGFMLEGLALNAVPKDGPAKLSSGRRG